MHNKITLEDHFAVPATLNDSKVFGGHVWDELGPRLLDFQERRLRAMDASGIEIMIASLNAPAIQAIPDAKLAIEVARVANDFLAEQVRKRPDRFVGVAALPMQDAAAATAELTRCVRDLGFKGALVNGFSEVGNKVDFYDHAGFDEFWACVERLDVPFYLHPRNPIPSQSALYEGHSWLMGPNWAFAATTSVHALRLIGSGIFDKHPRLNIVLGHLGEGLPFYIWRIDNRNSWMKAPHKYAAKKPVVDYFRANFHVTTSGHYSTPALMNTIAELGVDRVMFSVDYPFEDCGEAAEWFDNVSFADADRAKIGRENAIKLFKLARK